MQINVLWSGREYYSLENCIVDIKADRVDVDSMIVGRYEEKIYRVRYRIIADGQWQTQRCEVDCHHDNTEIKIVLERDANGRWLQNGNHAVAFDGCTDVDIPVTPFTNALPINRLRLQTGDTQHVRIVYIDLLNNDIRAVKQLYTRKSANIYHYENVPNDFEADIEVDDHGLVIDYPQLFARTQAVVSAYKV